MNDWETLLKAALIGSERPWSLPAIERSQGDDPVACLLREVQSQQASSNTSGLLLRLAGVMATCRRAGWMPSPTEEQPLTAAPPESRPVAEGVWGSLLSQVLNSGLPRLLHQILFAMDQAGLRVHPAQLPALLKAGRQSVAIRAQLLPVLGERGRWLAACHPDWAYAQSVGEEIDPQALWDHGTMEQRRGLLIAERSTLPANARERLQADWGDLAAKDRVVLITTLRQGLSQDDEVFLTAQLKDRSQEVRRIAANLLAALPASAYSQRIVDRAKALVQEVRVNSGVVGRLLNRLMSDPGPSSWDLQAPESIDENWKSDQLDIDAPKFVVLGQRALWLYQLTSRTPLRWWTDYTGMSPAECVSWAMVGEWSQALLHGWCHALLWQPDPQWAQALLHHISPVNVEERGLLLAQLSPQQRDHYHLEQLNTSVDVFLVAASCLEGCDPHTHVGQDLSVHLAQKLRQLIEQGALINNYSFRNALPDLLCCLHPAELGTLLNLPRHPDETASLSDVLSLVEQVLRIRQQLFYLSETTRTS